MKKRFLTFLFLPVALTCLWASNVRAKEPQAGQAANGDAQQAGALMKNAQAFAEAFEKGDAKAVAAFWAEDGDCVDLNGRYLHGRPSIENAFKDFFAENKGLIGWDPASSQIRSWSFVADGSIGENTYATGGGYYGGGFRPGAFLTGYAAGVYSSQ